jgi:hypothetical protein
MKLPKHIFIVLLTMIFVNQGSAQCKRFIQKRCLPILSPYVHNGQMNSIDLFPGESASLKIPFHSGNDYRLLTCGQELLEGVYFEVQTSDKEVVYTSKNKDQKYWDFNVESTQELTVTVYAPPVESEDELNPRGCVGLIIGFKDHSK